MSQSRKSRLCLNQEQLQTLFTQAPKPLTAAEKDKLYRYLVGQESLSDIRAHHPDCTPQHIHYLISKLPLARRNPRPDTPSPLSAKTINAVFREYDGKYTEEQKNIIRAYLQKNQSAESVLRKHPGLTRQELNLLVRRFRRNARLEGALRGVSSFRHLHPDQFDWDMVFYNYPAAQAAALKQMIFGGKSQKLAVVAKANGMKADSLNLLLNNYAKRLEKRRNLYDKERPHQNAQEQAVLLSILNRIPIPPSHRSIVWLMHSQHKTAKQLAQMHDCTPANIYKVLENVRERMVQADNISESDWVGLGKLFGAASGAPPPPADLERRLAELSAWLPPLFADIARDYYAATPPPLLSARYGLSQSRIRVIIQDVQDLLGSRQGKQENLK